MIHLLLLAFSLNSVSCYPGALCNVTFTIPKPCSQVFSGLTEMMELWNTDTECPGQCEQRYYLSPQRGPPLSPVTLANSGEQCDKCPCGQRCLYKVKQTSESRVDGSHITPVIRYVDDLFFEKMSEDSGVCTVFGHSHSTGPAWFDYTTNYCNMKNLVDGAGFSKLDGYSESSSVDLCMQFDKIEEFGNCNRF